MDRMPMPLSPGRLLRARLFRPALYDGVRERADAGDGDGDEVAVVEGEVVRGDDAGAGEEHGAVGEVVLAGEPAGELVEAAGHFAGVRFAAVDGLSAAF